MHPVLSSLLLSWLQMKEEKLPNGKMVAVVYLDQHVHVSPDHWEMDRILYCNGAMYVHSQVWHGKEIRVVAFLGRSIEIHQNCLFTL